MNRPIAALSLSATLAAGCAGPIASHRVPVMSPSAATLTADLYVPQGAAPFPALILLHGCNGIGRNVLAWAQWLQAEGYAALVLDSFGGRGFTSICGDGSVFGGGPRSSDVFAAARYLATLPGIDQDRIGVIGWAHGGRAGLRAANYEPVYRDVRVRAPVAVYPDSGATSCLPPVANDSGSVNRPATRSPAPRRLRTPARGWPGPASCARRRRCRSAAASRPPARSGTRPGPVWPCPARQGARPAGGAAPPGWR